jgi:dTDP-4-amino-4,6-dideoxygalactose transaminase
MSYPLIPFNRPALLGNEIAYITEAVRAGQASGDGKFTRACHAALESALGVPKALLTTSCTHALEMSAILLDLEPGDEVILPSFTFVSTANAFVLRGARPVFADIRPDTLNLDERQLESLVTPRTRAIVVVHYAGVACEMDEIAAVAARHGVPIVEDNAHGLFAKYKGRHLGTLGRFGTQSFHETKNITCGEGGALLLTDPRDVERAEIIREKGTNRTRFFRGQVDKYTWVDTGSSYLPSDLLAAYLLGQLEMADEIQRRRARIWLFYNDALREWAASSGVSLPYVPSHCDQAYHMFYLLMPSIDERQRLIEHLKGKGILSVFHYLPLHASEMGRRYGAHEDDCPVTSRVSDTLVRLPFYNDLTEDEQRRIVDTILEL